MQSEAGYLNLFEGLFGFLRHVGATKSKSKHASHWSALSDRVSGALDNLNGLMSPHGLAAVLKSLLQNDDPAIRRKALVLLNSKVDALDHVC